MSTIQVPYSQPVTCPICTETVEVRVDIEMSPDVVQRVSDQASVTTQQVTVSTTIKGANFSHACRSTDGTGEFEVVTADA